jgi:imidazolonepropionase-like amidohydrolase
MPSHCCTRLFSGIDPLRNQWLIGFLLILFLANGVAAELLPPGHRPIPLGVHALVGGRIVVRPGTMLDSGTIVIRNGMIEAVGKEVKPPADARIWEMKGETIYAGFIDLYLTVMAKTPVAEPERPQPELMAGASQFFGVPGQGRDAGQPGTGNEISQITPERRAVESYVPDPKALDTLHEIGFTSANIVPAKGLLRGTSVFVALADENPNDLIMKPDVFHHAAFASESAARGAYPVSQMGIIAAIRQTFFDAEHDALDQADFASRPERRGRPAFNPSLKALKPLLEKQMRLVIEPGSALMIDRAARLARELGLEFLLMSSGQEWRRPELAKAAGVPFIVPVNFPELPKLPEPDDWTAISLDQLRVWDWSAENASILRKQGLEIALTTHGLTDRKAFRKNLRLALDRGLSEDDALAALTTVPARLCGLEKRLGTIETNRIANLTVVTGGSYFNPENKIREVWIDGRPYPVADLAPKSANAGKEGSSESRSKSQSPEDKAKTAESNEEKAKKETARRELTKNRVARPPQKGRGPLAEPRGVLIRGATIWTCGPAGRIENGTLLVVDGKITRIGSMPISDETGLPAGSVLIVDGRGKHVTPGLIDAHSHALILGGVNEGTLPSTAMVRVSDVVNSETENIYQELAGGVTAANLLHGSANPIGGQNCLVKLKEGAAPEDLKMRGAPLGIKFALGENVKQSNWGERTATRFPQTRMGVRTFFANRFTAAQQYLKDWEDFRRSGGLRPRRDLELEAIGEIIEGKRWIHCHGYRQDELLMMLRLMEDFGVKIGTLQHVLEGYKVADEIAKHGAGASCFSDWWAYKFEVYDAIPYAGSLMRERGVLVSFNSDDADLARRLYLEAAKAVKYGGTPEEEALKFVTANPAKQLRIDQRVGSLEPGKDGDFVLWSKPPLNSGTVCLETWIEGKKYFDRALDSDRTLAREREWKDLVEKAKKVQEISGSSGSLSEPAVAAFFHEALEHLHDRQNRHCEDE